MVQDNPTGVDNDVKPDLAFETTGNSNGESPGAVSEFSDTNGENGDIDDTLDVEEFIDRSMFGVPDATKAQPTDKIVVRKPEPKEFVTTCGDKAYQLPSAWVLTWAGTSGKEVDFLVLPTVQAEVGNRVKGCVRNCRILLAMNHLGVTFLWKVNLSDNRYNETALEIQELCIGSWLKVHNANGYYDSEPPLEAIPKPIWTKVPFGTLLKTAFKDRIIRSAEDPVIRRLLSGKRV
jgi:hypothetical protein